MSPDYVDVQSYFTEENPGIEIVDTIPSALSGEHGIVRFDSNDNLYHLNLNDENPVVVKRSAKTGQFIDKLSDSEQNIISGVKQLINNLESYESVLEQLKYSETDRGREEELRNHPQAMENYNRILQAQKEILNNAEKTRFNAFGSRVVLSDTRIKALEKSFKETKQYFKDLEKGISEDSKKPIAIKEHIISSKLDGLKLKADSVVRELNSMKYFLKAMNSMYPNHKVSYDKKFDKQEKKVKDLYSNLSVSSKLPSFKMNDGKNIKLNNKKSFGKSLSDDNAKLFSR